MKKIIILALSVFTVGLLLIQCKDEKNNQVSDSVSESDTLVSDSAKEIQKPEEVITYSEFIFPEGKKDSVMAVFKEKYSKEERYTILAINRLDEDNAWRADTLMIPSKIEEDFLKYSPFPKHLDILKDINKMVFFSYPIQAYAAYENGKLVKWGPTSMGKKAAQTKTGLMFSNWKKTLAISTVNKSWKLPYNFNIHNTLGIGWHQFDLPGYPASHSCLRLLMDDAKWMYSFGEQWVLTPDGAKVRANGTPVIVFGEYAWGQKKPWKQLAKDHKSTEYSIEDMEKEVQPFKEKILQEQSNRAQVIAEVETEKNKTTP